MRMAQREGRKEVSRMLKFDMDVSQAIHLGTIIPGAAGGAGYGVGGR